MTKIKEIKLKKSNYNNKKYIKDTYMELLTHIMLSNYPTSQYASKLFDIIKGHLPHVHIYADDTQSYLSFKPDTAVNANDAVNAMEVCIRDFRTRMLHDKPKLNDNKTEFILIGTRQQLAKVDGISLCVGDSKVSPVKSAKNLGTWIDSNLHFKVNVNNTCKAAYHHLTNVRRIRKYLYEKASQTLIHALVIGRIDYCNSILYGLPARELTKLQRLQNSAARITFNIPKMCHVAPVLRELHWLPIQFRIQFKFIMITFKVINGQGPIYLQELVKLQQDGAYKLRSSNKGLILQAPNAITKETLGDRAYVCST